MVWIMEPMSGFSRLVPVVQEGQCTDGAIFASCRCTGALTICDCSNGLIRTELLPHFNN